MPLFGFCSVPAKWASFLTLSAANRRANPFPDQLTNDKIVPPLAQRQPLLWGYDSGGCSHVCNTQVRQAAHSIQTKIQPAQTCHWAAITSHLSCKQRNNPVKLSGKADNKGKNTTNLCLNFQNPLSVHEIMTLQKMQSSDNVLILVIEKMPSFYILPIFYIWQSGQD